MIALDFSRGFTRRKRLAALKLCLALLNVSLQTLARVFGLKQLLLQLALERETVVQWYFRAGLHGALDATDGHRCLRRRRKLSRIFEDLFKKRLCCVCN